MSVFTIIGCLILAFFLWMGHRAGQVGGEDSISPSSFYALILIIALSGFLIAMGILY